MEPKHIAPQPYCVLCRNTLPTTKQFTLPEGDGFNDWELNVLGFFNLSDNVKAPLQVHMFKSNLADDGSFPWGPPLRLRKSASGERQSVVARSDLLSNRKVDLLWPLFFAHLDCWKIARLVQPRLTSCWLYRFAQATQPIVTPDFWSHQGNLRLDAKLPCDSADGTNPKKSGLRNILCRCSCLPLELQRAVVHCLPRDDLAASLAFAAHTASSLLGLVSDEATPSTHTRRLLRDESAADFGWLRWSTVSIFGQTYLTRIEIVEDTEPDPHIENFADRCIRLRLGQIRRARFVLGIYGVRALRIVYRDWSTSAWAGGPGRGGWYGVIDGLDPRSLQIKEDDLKAVSVGFFHESSERTPETRSSRWQSHVLWNIDPKLVHWDLMRIVDTAPFPAQVLHHHFRHLCQYLQLEVDGRYATGLTVYCDKHGIRGISTHLGQDHSQTVGCRQGHPFYFALGPDERLNLVALGMVEPHVSGVTPWDGPFLLVSTNRDRSAFFGPFVLEQHSMARWSLIASESLPLAGPGHVTGLIVDALTLDGPGQPLLQGIGASFVTYGDDDDREYNEDDETPPPGRQSFLLPRLPLLLQLTHYPATHFWGFFSVAKLCNVRKLELRRAGWHCTGLCIHYDDNSVETLGQWDGHPDSSSVSEITEIYNSANGPLDSITFRYAELERPDSYIADICIGEPPEGTLANSLPNSSGRKFVWRASDPHTKSLAWWFGENYDYVEPWRGEWVRLKVLLSRRRACMLSV